MSAVACGSDPKFIVPNDFHGTAHITFCVNSNQGTTIKLAPDGSGRSSVCDSNMKKFVVQRANGEVIKATIDVKTTGDGIPVSATFEVP